MYNKIDSNFFKKISYHPALIFIVFFVLVNLDTVAQCNFKSIGHRGGASYDYPENTLISLEQGFMEDIFAAEIDIRRTADDVLVLMHDYYIDRTTNGTGNIEDLTLDYIKSLDAGSWKDSTFAGTKVPTLTEALLLAQQYGKKLYLNMKVYEPNLILKSLGESGVDEDIILLDPDDLDKVKEYHSIMPNTPLVYFGAFPDEDDLPDFFTELKENGVVAIEIPADFIHDDYGYNYEVLRNLAHQNGIEFWAYTVNDEAYFQYLKDFGIDGLETDRPSAARQFFCDDLSGGFFPEKRITGQWDFKFNLDGTIGSQLVYMGDSTIENQRIQFGTIESFGLPAIEDEIVDIARIPAFDESHALRFFSNFAPEGLPGGLACDNTYSIIYDLLKPEGNDSYTSLLQTSNSNSDDGDFFLLGESNSFGIVEQYSSGFADSTWVRLALVFDLYNERLDEYLNGNYVGTVVLEDSQDGRFCLNNNWGVQASHFFSDDNGETNPVFVSSIQIRDYAMSSSEIEYLGGPKATKIDNSILPDMETVCPEFIDDISASLVNSVLELTADAGENVNYKWEVNYGNGWEKITGTQYRNVASSKLLIQNPIVSMNGLMYRCIASNNCYTVSDVYTIEGINTGINELKEKNLFTVFPNPSNGNFTISFDNILFDPVNIQIFTSTGIMVFETETKETRMNINLSSGTYFVQVKNSYYNETKKLVIYN